MRRLLLKRSLRHNFHTKSVSKKVFPQHLRYTSKWIRLKSRLMRASNPFRHIQEVFPSRPPRPPPSRSVAVVHQRCLQFCGCWREAWGRVCWVCCRSSRAALTIRGRSSWLARPTGRPPRRPGPGSGWFHRPSSDERAGKNIAKYCYTDQYMFFKVAIFQKKKKKCFKSKVKILNQEYWQIRGLNL